MVRGRWRAGVVHVSRDLNVLSGTVRVASSGIIIVAGFSPCIESLGKEPHGRSHRRGQRRCRGGGWQCPGSHSPAPRASDPGAAGFPRGLHPRSGTPGDAARGGADALPPGAAVLGESHDVEERHPPRPARHPDHLDGIRGGHRLRRRLDRLVAGHPVGGGADPRRSRRPARRYRGGGLGEGPAATPVHAAQSGEPDQRRHRLGGLRHRRRHSARRALHPLGHHPDGAGLVPGRHPGGDPDGGCRLPGVVEAARPYRPQHGPHRHALRGLPDGGADPRLGSPGGGGGRPDHLGLLEPAEHPGVPHPGGARLAAGDQPAERGAVPADRRRDTVAGLPFPARRAPGVGRYSRRRRGDPSGLAFPLPAAHGDDHPLPRPQARAAAAPDVLPGAACERGFGVPGRGLAGDRAVDPPDHERRLAVPLPRRGGADRGPGDHHRHRGARTAAAQGHRLGGARRPCRRPGGEGAVRGAANHRGAPGDPRGRASGAARSGGASWCLPLGRGGDGRPHRHHRRTHERRR